MKKMNKTTQFTQKSEWENAMTTEKHIQRCPPTSKYGKDDIQFQDFGELNNSVYEFSLSNIIAPSVI